MCSIEKTTVPSPNTVAVILPQGRAELHCGLHHAHCGRAPSSNGAMPSPSRLMEVWVILGLWEPMGAELSSQVKLSALLSWSMWAMGHSVEFLLCLSYF